MNKKKSVLKRIRTNERNRISNRSYKQMIKTTTKAFLIAANKKDINDSNNLKELNILLNNAYSKIDKAVKKNVIHSNNAARKKALLHKQLIN
uniref:30S ribosomal protein S20 n=1 Tax=Porphyridium purpureum TaxID=35688 RepID=W0RYG0_PORPP|nr:chloroplast 30S ribosomal protein S20 [Porphyridium purpureum]ATJ02866.1 30S ribosomal protein S20 [Porphyridium purpureum]BAO23639.1 chloroplast 30S ribosomal protein S20 [Porphyridium purpureum]